MIELKRIGLIIGLMLLLLAPAASVDTTHLIDMGNQQIGWGVLPSSFDSALGQVTTSFSKDVSGDTSRTVSVKGVAEEVRVTIYGNGTKEGPSNSTDFIGYNNSIHDLNLTYYARNITMLIEGYTDWNNTNQKIVNDTGYNYEDTYPEATIDESNGVSYINDSYTAVNDTWSAKSSDITINTSSSAEWAEGTDSSTASVSLDYNVSINNGTFNSAMILNTSFYVAPNTTPPSGGTEDDLDIRVDNSSGACLTINGDNGTQPNNGTQWTGDTDLSSCVQGESWFVVNIIFQNDGADDKAGEADVRFNNLSIKTNVTELPSRNISVDLGNDGDWHNVTGEYYSGDTYEATSGVISDSYLNLTNEIYTLVKGSGKANITIRWNDENRTRVDNVGISGVIGETVEVNKFLADGEFNTTTITKNVYGTPRINVNVNTSHTRMSYCNHTISIDSYEYMALSNSIFTVDDGVTIESYDSDSEPIPVLIKPEEAVTVNLTAWRPDAGAGATILDAAMESQVHNNTVNVLVDNVTSDKVSLWIDGEQEEVLNTSSGSVAFNVTNFSDKQVTLKAYSTGFGAAPERDPYVVASYIIVGALSLTILGLLVYGIYRKLR